MGWGRVSSAVAETRESPFPPVCAFGKVSDHVERNFRSGLPENGLVARQRFHQCNRIVAWNLSSAVRCAPITKGTPPTPKLEQRDDTPRSPPTLPGSHLSWRRPLPSCAAALLCAPGPRARPASPRAECATSSASARRLEPLAAPSCHQQPPPPTEQAERPPSELPPHLAARGASGKRAVRVANECLPATTVLWTLQDADVCATSASGWAGRMTAPPVGQRALNGLGVAAVGPVVAAGMRVAPPPPPPRPAPRAAKGWGVGSGG